MQTDATASWADLLRGRNGARSLALAGGTALHATNVYLVTTIMPSVVEDIGGIAYYAMNTTVFIMASIIGAALAGRLADQFGGKRVYLSALALFSLASVICATAPSMLTLIAGRAIQGLGGGVLVSMAYVLIRQVFPEHLWTRAMGLISAMWGIATLSGPAIGGVFAEYSTWRYAFWSLLPIAFILAVIVSLWLPAGKKDRQLSSALPTSRLLLLTASMLSVSLAGIAGAPALQAGLVIGGMLFLGWLIRVDRVHPVKLLPTGSYGPTRIRAIYLTMILLALVSTVEVFIPFFLQSLHGHSPLKAGYLTSMMAGGWSLGSMLSSGFTGNAAKRVVRFGPVLMSLSLLSFSWVIQQPSGFDQGLGFIFFLLNLLGIGMGIGTAWPHLLSYLLSSVPDHEGDLASSSLSTVQMYAMSVGAALAGLIVNSAGVHLSEDTQTVRRAAFWLFFLFGILVFFGLFSARRAVRTSAPSPSMSASST